MGLSSRFVGNFGAHRAVAAARRLLAGALAGLVLPAAAAASIDVDLAEFVQTGARTVYLRDVAKIETSLGGDSVQALGAVKLAVLGEGRAALKLEAKRVARMIALQQPALAGLVRLTGARAVVVSATEGDGRDLTADIRRLILDDLGSRATDIELQSLHLPPHAESAFARVDAVRLRPDDGRRWARRMPFVVEGMDDGRVAAVARIEATFSGSLRLCVLKRNIAVGERIVRSDCAWVAESLDRISPAALTEWSNFGRLGESTRPLVAGERPTALDATKLAGGVRRGDRVKLIVRNAGVMVEQHAVAMTRASPGQNVRVLNSASGGIFTARVIGGGIVEMEL